MCGLIFLIVGLLFLKALQLIITMLLFVIKHIILFKILNNHRIFSMLFDMLCNIEDSSIVLEDIMDYCKYDTKVIGKSCFIIGRYNR